MGLKKIKAALILTGITTLVGGLTCLLLNLSEILSWIMFIPMTIAVIYILLQLCKIHKDKKDRIFIMLLSIALVIVIPLLITYPAIGNDDETIIKNDTLYIGGFYSKEMPDIEYYRC